MPLGVSGHVVGYKLPDEACRTMEYDVMNSHRKPFLLSFSRMNYRGLPRHRYFPNVSYVPESRRRVGRLLNGRK